MKIKNVRRSAFVILRALIASLLCFTAVMLALFALEALPQQRLAGGGEVKRGKNASEHSRIKSKMAQAIPYSGPPRDLSPVTAVRTGKLRYMAPIDPETVEKHYHPEPILPKPPTKSGGPAGPIQSVAGPLISAPTATGLTFEGVGVGLGGFNPGANPPDVNG